jgi:hypothetical protein
MFPVMSGVMIDGTFIDIKELKQRQKEGMIAKN